MRGAVTQQTNAPHRTREGYLAFGVVTKAALPIHWKRSFPLKQAKTFRGVFANQNIVCKLSDPATVRFVREGFSIGRVSEVVHPTP